MSMIRERALANATNCQTRALANYTVVRMRQGLQCRGGSLFTSLQVVSCLPVHGPGNETVNEGECQKVGEVCEVMYTEKIYGAREVVDVKKVDYNCHLVRCYKKNPVFLMREPGNEAE